MHIRPFPAAFLLAALLAGAPARGAEAPRVELTRDPAGEVTVGTPLEVTLTLLVPSFMPEPPVWPDLGIADAITRLPGRATTPVTRRIGAESWSGLARTYEIIPQRAADYDLGPAEIALTYADPETSQPVAATAPVPDLAFRATLPPGAEGMDPFVPATALTLTATLDGLPAAPKPGDAATLTLTTTAEGPPAMLLPPLAGEIPDQPGLRAYPKEPRLTDKPGERGGPPTATRIETITYVIESPGQYRLPALTLDWWNTATRTRAQATAEGFAIDAGAAPAPPPPHPLRRFALLVALGVALAGAFGALALRRRHRPPAPPGPRALRRAALKAARTGPVGAIRPRLAAWLAALPAPLAPPASARIEAALRALEERAYGTAAPAGDEASLRRRLRAEIARARPGVEAAAPALPGLNP